MAGRAYNPSTLDSEQEEQKFKINLCYIVSARLAYDMWDSLNSETKQNSWNNSLKSEVKKSNPN